MKVLFHSKSAEPLGYRTSRLRNCEVRSSNLFGRANPHLNSITHARAPRAHLGAEMRLRRRLRITVPRKTGHTQKIDVSPSEVCEHQ